jgi:hypothetical protein
VAATVAAALAFSIGGHAAPGQQSSGTATEARMLEGGWVRLDTAGSGEFGGLTSKFTPASLTPAATAMMTEARGRQNAPRGRAFVENRVHKEGEPYIVVDRPCGGGLAGGALGVNPDSGAIHIIVHKDEVVIAPERGGSRHIFMDGRPHPDPAQRTPTASGHGVGHFENSVLVVDTVGFAPGPVTAGGYRTPETHLAERFEVSPDGKKLTIKYTWNDPKLYVTPHSYEYVLERLPAGSYALEDWCDASDPIEQQSIVPPKQIQ